MCPVLQAQCGLNFFSYKLITTFNIPTEQIDVRHVNT